MNRRTRHIVILSLLLLTAGAPRISAQPWIPQDEDNAFGGKPGMHLFLPSQFIRSIQDDRLTMARARYFEAACQSAADRGEYDRALSYADSMIYLAEHRPIRGVRPTHCYQQRARMLRALGRDKEACQAYDRAVAVKNTAMRMEQSEVMREMQASYELDRLALDKALLTASHHAKALNSMILLLLVVVTGIGFIYVANRRTKRLQQELLHQMQQARESEEKKNAFINSVGHEVRTPLNSISGFSELLCTEKLLPEAHAQYCEIIQESRRQLRYLFDDMLEVAYLENLQEPLPCSYLDLCTLCRTQLRMMKVRFPKPGVVYTEAVPTEKIAMISSEKYLNLLVSTLLGNAYKFTGQGQIRIECDREGADRVYIAIADTGCGIPPEHREYVFERFTKLDAFSQGNGLGLYLCRLIVRRLHGEIRIDPDYTDGTRMVVTLPRK